MTMKIDALFMNLHRRYLNLDVKIGGFLGIYYLSAFLRDNGYNAKGFSGTLIDGKSVLDEICTQGSISVLGLYCDYDNVTENIYISKYVKENYHIPVIVGGPQASALGYSFFLKSKCDAVVIGEGEVTVLELVKYYINNEGTLDTILGISYVKLSKVVQTQNRPLIPNLDTLPFITEECYLEPVYFYQNLTIMTGRGCPFNCAFCHEGIGKQVRFRSVENILDEIDEYIQKTCCEDLCIYFTDDTFTLDATRVKMICEGIKSRNRIKCSIKFFCEGHVHTLYKKPEMIKQLAENGCYRLQLGIEAGTDKILKLYDKNTTTEEIATVVRLACAFGIKQIYGNIILGSAFFNEEIFEADKKFVKELLRIGKGIIEIGVVTYWALPNTKMTTHPEGYGMKICDTEFLTSLGEFPQAETEKFDRLEIAEKQFELETLIEKEMIYILESGQIPTSTILEWFSQSDLRYQGAWFFLLKRIEHLYAFYEMIYLGEGFESKNLEDIDTAHPMRIVYLYRFIKKISYNTASICDEVFTEKEICVVTLTTGKLSVKEIAEKVDMNIRAVKEILDRLERMHLIVYTLC